MSVLLPAGVNGVWAELKAWEEDGQGSVVENR
jgi:hypothetical protein